MFINKNGVLNNYFYFFVFFFLLLLIVLSLKLPFHESILCKKNLSGLQRSVIVVEKKNHAKLQTRPTLTEHFFKNLRVFQHDFNPEIRPSCWLNLFSIQKSIVLYRQVTFILFVDKWVMFNYLLLYGSLVVEK